MAKKSKKSLEKAVTPGKVITPEVIKEKSAIRIDIEGEFELKGKDNDVMWILKDQTKKHFFDFFGKVGDEMVPSLIWFEDHYLYISNFAEFMDDMDNLKVVAQQHIERNNIKECVFACEVDEETDDGKDSLLTISYQNKQVFGAFCFKINEVDGKRELEQYEAERLFYQCEQYLNFYSTYDKSK